MHYRFYLLGEDGHIQNAHDHICEDDSTALDKAGKVSWDGVIEVWQASRRVAILKKGDEVLIERDRRSL